MASKSTTTAAAKAKAAEKPDAEAEAEASAKEEQKQKAAATDADEFRAREEQKVIEEKRRLDEKAAADEKQKQDTAGEDKGDAAKSAKAKAHPKGAVETPKPEGETSDVVPLPDESTDATAEDQPPLKIKDGWAIPREQFDRLMNSGGMPAFCDKHGIGFRGGVHQGDITIL